MQLRLTWTGFAAIVAIVASFGAISLAGPIALDPAVAPFVTGGTLFAARVDTTRIQARWVNFRRLNALIQLGFDERAISQTDAARWLGDFRRAGGKVIYAVAFMGDPGSLPGVVIVPLEAASDAKAIAGLLVSGEAGGADRRGGFEAIVLHQAVVYGMTNQVEKMKIARPVDRAAFAAGLEGLGDAAVKVVFSPSEALGLVGSELFPDNLPDEAGAGSPGMLINELDWLGVGLTPGARSSARLVIKCKEKAGVADYSDLCDSLLNTFIRVTGGGPIEASLKPGVADTGLTVNLNGDELARLGPRIDRALQVAGAATRAAATQP